jgi:hypothetical protein
MTITKLRYVKDGRDETLTAPIDRVEVTLDGQMKEFVSDPPPTPPAAAPDPVPQTPPSGEPLAPFKVIHTIHLDDDGAVAEQQFRALKPFSRVIVPNGDVPLKKALRVAVGHVWIVGAGPQSRLIDDDLAPGDDGLRCCIGVSAVDEVYIEGLRFRSPDGSIDKRANGINWSGKSGCVMGCTFERCLHGILLEEKSRGVGIAENHFLGGCAYGVYVNGPNARILRNVFDQVIHAAVRTGGFRDLSVFENICNGDPEGAGRTEPSRITIQEGDGAVVQGNRLTNTSISIFPLDTNTGLAGKKGDVQAFAAARTRNVRCEGNTIKGKGGVEIGQRAENVVYVGEPEPDVGKKDKVVNYGQPPRAITLVAAKNVTVNGKKVA